MTHLEWLRRPPRRRSLKTVRELMEKYRWLEERVGQGIPLPIPEERARVYARRLRRSRAVHVTRLPRFDKSAAIWTWGHKIAEENVTPLRVRKRAEILAELCQLVVDNRLDDAAFRQQASVLLIPDPASTRPSRAADVREVLSRSARRIRPILQLRIELKLLGDGAGGNGLGWLDGIYDEGVDTFFANRAPPRRRRWKTYPASTQTSHSCFRSGPPDPHHATAATKHPRLKIAVHH